jgi:hypothetical protein
MRQPFDIYIGRPTRVRLSVAVPWHDMKWGNPFIINIHGSRLEVVAKYRIWLPEQEELMAALPELKDKVLGCWCAPFPCHGDVLAELVNQLYEST